MGKERKTEARENSKGGWKEFRRWLGRGTKEPEAVTLGMAAGEGLTGLGGCGTDTMGLGRPWPYLYPHIFPECLLYTRSAAGDTEMEKTLQLTIY